MNKSWSPLQPEQYDELKSFVGQDNKAMVDYIYRTRVVTVSDLLEKFPELAGSAMDMLSVIGKVNGAIFNKFSSAVYPAEVAPTIQDSAYAIGTLIKGK